MGSRKSEVDMALIPNKADPRYSGKNEMPASEKTEWPQRLEQSAHKRAILENGLPPSF